MDYKEKATILRVCSSKKGERCSRCPAFGQGERYCKRNAMKDGAAAITELLANDNQVKESLQLNGFETLDALLEAYNQVMAENAALLKMQPVRLDDTGAKAAALAADVSELRQKLAEAEGACAYHKSAMESYREGARARYKLMYSRIKKLSEALEQERLRAEAAEAQRDAAIKELDGVAAAVDDLSDFIDEQVHPYTSYDLYVALRENADAISMWQFEPEWRGQKGAI